MSKNLDLSKYKRMARILEIIMRIFAWVGISAAVITTLIGIVFLFLPDTSSVFSLIKNDSFRLSPDGLLMFKVNTFAVGPGVIKTLMVRIMFIVAAISITITPIFQQLSLILGTIKDDKPFAPENAKRLTKIGVVLIIGAVIIRLAEFFVALTIVDKLKLDNVTVNLNADSNMILMGFMVLILAGVFKYGSYLQRQYDSTV